MIADAFAALLHARRTARAAGRHTARLITTVPHRFLSVKGKTAT